MPPATFRALCAACGWTPQAVALRVGRRRNAGTEWATGRVRVPAEVAEWLERVAAALAAVPPPVTAAPSCAPRSAPHAAGRTGAA